jgi:hypothetical protein
MKQLSYTQEFFLCAVNKKGDIPALKAAEVSACLSIGTILELLDHGYIEKGEKDKLAIVKPWDDSFSYLRATYEAIEAQKKPQDIVALAFSSGNKELKRDLQGVWDSLVEAGCTDDLPEQGIFKNQTKLIPKPEVVRNIIEKLRAEFLEDGTLTKETICLAAFLDASGIIRDFFSKYERDILKQRLAEIREDESYAYVRDIIDSIAATMIVIIAAASS